MNIPVHELLHYHHNYFPCPIFYKVICVVCTYFRLQAAQIRSTTAFWREIFAHVHLTPLQVLFDLYSLMSSNNCLTYVCATKLLSSCDQVLHYFVKWKRAPIPFEEKTRSLFSLISPLLDHCTSVADVRVWVLFWPEFFSPFSRLPK